MRNTVRQGWKNTGLTFLSLSAVVGIYCGFAVGLPLVKQSPLARYGWIVITIAMVLIYLAAVRWIERRRVSELSVAHMLPELAGGLLFGIALFTAVIAGLWLAGVYRPIGGGGYVSLGFAFLVWCAIGVQEEILFRGLLYRLCSPIFGTWGAVILSGVVFGLVHETNPGSTLAALSAVAIAGLLLGASFALTGRLWLPIGIHIGWNFAEGSLFGTAVSGGQLGGSVIVGKLSGPDILTGGRFGPEASIVTIVVLLLATAFLVWRLARSRRAEPPIWRAGPTSSSTTGEA